MHFPLNETSLSMKTISRFAIVAFSITVSSSSVFAQDDERVNPLEDVTREMKVAAGHLSKTATDKPTQKAQEDAVLKLDKLIVELEERKKRRGNGDGDPTIPAEESMVRKGPGGDGELRPAKMQGDRWGELPAHERDRILQSLTEGFPPHYQAVLEAYYKRLAVEKKAEEPDFVAAPKFGAAPKPAPAAEMKAGTSKPVAAPKMSSPTKKTDK